MIHRSRVPLRSPNRTAADLLAFCVLLFGVVAWGSGCVVDVPDATCLQTADCPAAHICVELTCVTIAEVSACEGAPPNAAAGDACGTCSAGRWTCDGGAWSCFGDRENACGGCAPLPGAPGDACGACGGTWTCEGDALVCPDRRNACGGCGNLAPANAAIGRSCATDDNDGSGDDGVWTCASPNDVACHSPVVNACGGTATLDAIPGEACGPCNRGVATCLDADTIDCCYGDTETCGEQAAPLDLCGGCAGIPDVVGEPCGVCGAGTWELDCGRGIAVCRGDTANACGGCTTLDETPGTDCGVGAAWACVGPEAVVCTTDGATNACGGSASLSGTPGERCGPCDDGRWACVSPDQTACVGGASLSACGTCAAADQALGTACGTQGGVVQCADDASVGEPVVLCAPPDGRDACGGTTAAGQVPFEPCGECGGRWACDASQALRCILAPSQQPMTRYRDDDTDGYGDRNDPGQAICGNGEGYALNALDCDDTRGDVHPERDEIPGNGRDDDCDRGTPD